jgi:hypothetical protein
LLARCRRLPFISIGEKRARGRTLFQLAQLGGGAGSGGGAAKQKATGFGATPTAAEQAVAASKVQSVYRGSAARKHRPPAAKEVPKAAAAAEKAKAAAAAAEEAEAPAEEAEAAALRRRVAELQAEGDTQRGLIGALQAKLEAQRELTRSLQAERARQPQEPPPWQHPLQGKLWADEALALERAAAARRQALLVPLQMYALLVMGFVKGAASAGAAQHEHQQGRNQPARRHRVRDPGRKAG